MRLLSFFTLCLLLSSCGYHLMTMDRGVVPDDVQVVRIMGAGGNDHFLRKFQAYARGKASYEIVRASAESRADAEIHIGSLNESIPPISFDASGIVTVVRMSLSSDIKLWRDSELIWSSSPISVFEDVNVSGGPAAIEAAKRRIRSDLEEQWIRQAWLKLSSDF